MLCLRAGHYSSPLLNSGEKLHTLTAPPFGVLIVSVDGKQQLKKGRESRRTFYLASDSATSSASTSPPAAPLVAKVAMAAATSLKDTASFKNHCIQRFFFQVGIYITLLGIEICLCQGPFFKRAVLKNNDQTSKLTRRPIPF